MRRTRLLTLAAAATLALAACGSATGEAQVTAPASAAATATSSSMASSSADAGTGSSAAASPSGEVMAAGAYLTLAEYESQMASRAGTAVVYFFHAGWCPNCRATEASLTADGVPAGLTIVKVDYDTETALRKQYGVTQQHTFVQVGADGAELARWTGTESGAAIKAKTV